MWHRVTPSTLQCIYNVFTSFHRPSPPVSEMGNSCIQCILCHAVPPQFSWHADAQTIWYWLYLLATRSTCRIPCFQDHSRLDLTPTPSYCHTSQCCIHSLSGISTTQHSLYHATQTRHQNSCPYLSHVLSTSLDVIPAGSIHFPSHEDSSKSLLLPSDISDLSRVRSLHFWSPYPCVSMSSHTTLHFSPMSIPLLFCGSFLFLSLGARVPRNEWEHFRNIAGTGSIFLHCNWQTHLENIWNVFAWWDWNVPNRYI